MFLKEIFEKMYFEKNSEDNKIMLLITVLKYTQVHQT